MSMTKQQKIAGIALCGMFTLLVADVAFGTGKEMREAGKVCDKFLASAEGQEHIESIAKPGVAVNFTLPNGEICSSDGSPQFQGAPLTFGLLK